MATHRVDSIWRLETALSRWSARAHEAARRAAFRAWPQLAAAGLAIEARGLGPPAIPHLFALDLVQIPPTQNDDLLELYGRSEQALANRFSFFGETGDFDSEINWAPKARSAEWQTELHSFDFALDLALTFRISGDARYARHLRYLLADWTASNPPGCGAGWTPLALARRTRNSILAADLCRDAFEADADFRKLFGASLAQQVTYLAGQSRSTEDRRARLAASRALLLAGRAFGGGRGAGMSLAARALLAQAMDDGPASFPDHPQPIRQYELAAACRDFALFGESGAGDEWAREKLRAALETLEGMLHPDGTLPLFGREPLPSPDAVSTLFALGAMALGVGRWKDLGEFGILPYMVFGESGKRGFDKLTRGAWVAGSQLQSGSGIFRLGDGKASAMLISALPGNSTRDHRDLFSYELTVCGQRTVVDSGIPSSAAEGDFASGASHNVFLVDGDAPRVDPRWGVQAVPVASGNGVEGIWLRLGWRDSSGGTTPPPSPFNDPESKRRVEHQRGCLLVDGRFWVVLDRVTGCGTHRLESLIHFYPAFVLEVRDGLVLARSGAASVAVQPLAFGDGNAPGSAECKVEAPGWYAPTPGVRYPSPVLALEWPEASIPCVFGYVIGTKPDAVTRARISDASEAGVKVILDGIEFIIELP